MTTFLLIIFATFSYIIHFERYHHRNSTYMLVNSKVGEAMQKMHDRKNIGKLVLDPSLEPKPKPATPAKGKSGKEKKPAKESSEEKKDKEAKEEDKKPAENGEKNGEKNGEEPITNGNSDEGQSRTFVTRHE